MWIAKNWNDYEVLDTSDGEKLERWGKYILIRPDPQVIWKNTDLHPKWKQINGHYHRSTKGGGEWEFFKLPEQWTIHYSLPDEVFQRKKKQDILFHLKPFSFKHTGVFPEQAINWDWSSRIIANATAKGRNIRVLNLFAYTGGATIASAMAGANVTHIDASKGMVNWAKENANSSGLSDAPIRWLVDDCVKFVEREIRRGNSYDAIIMDPPSYGRGPRGEIWKIEDSLYEFIVSCSKLLSKTPLFFLINSYTTGLQPGVLMYMLQTLISPKSIGGIVSAQEIGLPITGHKQKGLFLPCGASGRCEWKI